MQAVATVKEDIVNSKKALDAYKVYLDAQFDKHKYLRISMKTGKQRTGLQNRALHKFCEMLADEMNAAGFDFRVFIKEGYPVPFTKELVKEHIWKPIQKAVTRHSSTTKPETGEYTKIYESLNVKLAEHGLHVPWPCRESMNDER